MSKDVHTLISETCEYVVTHGKRKFRLQMELRLLINWRYERVYWVIQVGSMLSQESL